MREHVCERVCVYVCLSNTCTQLGMGWEAGRIMLGLDMK